MFAAPIIPIDSITVPIEIGIPMALATWEIMAPF